MLHKKFKNKLNFEFNVLIIVFKLFWLKNLKKLLDKIVFLMNQNC